MQTIANNLNVTVTRVFGMPEIGKGEMNHAGGIVKNTIRRQIALGDFYSTVDEMVGVLQDGFKYNESPKYVIRKITGNKLYEKRQN